MVLIDHEVQTLPEDQARKVLSPHEREHLAVLAWESLEEDFAAIDPQGEALALKRDADIQSGATKPIDHTEFLRAT